MSIDQGYRRYAIYFAPAPESALAKFAASWLGYDVETGESVARPSVEGLPAPLEKLTASPSRYGFHGTLKAPFRLRDAEGVSVEALDAELARFAAAQTPPPDMPLRFEGASGFVSLRAAEPTPEFNALAFRIVQHFEPFRAPLNEDEMAKRLSAPLSERQRTLLDAFGYPYVDDQFRFHLTLTGRQNREEADTTIAVLQPLLGPIIADPMPVRDLCLFGDPGDGRPFKVLSRHRLGSAA